MAGRVRTDKYNSAVVRRVAVTAGVDPRTAARRLLGLPVAKASADKVDAAVERLGLSRPHGEQAA